MNFRALLVPLLLASFGWAQKIDLATQVEGKLNNVVRGPLTGSFCVLANGDVSWFNLIPCGSLDATFLTHGQTLVYGQANGKYKPGTVLGGGNIDLGHQSEQPIWYTGSAKYKPQKPLNDSRDLYDCSYKRDAAAPLNAATAIGVGAFDGAQTTFPSGCRLKLTSTWTVQNHIGFILHGNSNAGGAGTWVTGSPTLSYCGDANGTILNLQRAHSFTVENLAFEGKGSGCVNAALNGIVVDLTGPGNLISTFGVFRNLNISGTNFQGGIPSTHFTGISFSPAQTNNVEDMRIYDSSVNCSAVGSGIGTATTGITFNGSFNTKEEVLTHVNVGGCGTGINTGTGGVAIRDGDYGLNNLDIRVLGNSDPTIIDNVTSEQSRLFFQGGGQWPVWLAHNHAAPGNGAITGDVEFDLGTSSTNGTYTLVNNGTDAPNVGHLFFPVASNKYASAIYINNAFGFGQPLSGNSAWLMPQGHQFGLSYTVMNGGYIRVGQSFANDIQGAEDAGYGFFNSVGYDVPGLQYSNSAFNGVRAGGVSVGRDSMFLGNANIVLKAMWPIPVQTMTCTVNGAPGSQGYFVQVYAKDAAGKRSGSAVGQPGVLCRNAQAVLSGTDSLTVTWPLTPGATGGFDVVLLNPANSGQGGLMTTTAAGISTYTITANPTYNYSFPAYSESAQTTINGALTVNGVLTLNSFTPPTCDASRRGQFNYVAGGTGVKDIVQVCVKSAGDTYSWFVIY